MMAKTRSKIDWSKVLHVIEKIDARINWKKVLYVYEVLFAIPITLSMVIWTLLLIGFFNLCLAASTVYYSVLYFDFSWVGWLVGIILAILPYLPFLIYMILRDAARVHGCKKPSWTKSFLTGIVQSCLVVGAFALFVEIASKQ